MLGLGEKYTHLTGIPRSSTRCDINICIRERWIRIGMTVGWGHRGGGKEAAAIQNNPDSKIKFQMNRRCFLPQFLSKIPCHPEILSQKQTFVISEIPYCERMRDPPFIGAVRLNFVRFEKMCIKVAMN